MVFYLSSPYRCSFRYRFHFNDQFIDLILNRDLVKFGYPLIYYLSSSHLLNYQCFYELKHLLPQLNSNSDLSSSRLAQPSLCSYFYACFSAWLVFVGLACLCTSSVDLSPGFCPSRGTHVRAYTQTESQYSGMRWWDHRIYA